MPQSLAQIYLHLVFSTKDRRPFLLDPGLREEAHKFLGGTCKQLDCPILRVGGVEDHVHILCRLGRTISVSDLVKELKRESSKWVKKKDLALNDFHWQNGYGAFCRSEAVVDSWSKKQCGRKFGQAIAALGGSMFCGAGHLEALEAESMISARTEMAVRSLCNAFGVGSSRQQQPRVRCATLGF